MSMLKKLEETALFLSSRGIKPKFTVILGTGMGTDFISKMDIILELAYEQIPNFPVSTVEYHKGKLLYGKVSDKNVLAFQGRFHYYEGYSMEEIVFPIRVSKFLGSKYLLLSNAAGCINLGWKKGDLMLIEDHINLQNGNPLIGKNEEKLGHRFPDMIEPYSLMLNDMVIKSASKESITLRKGIYAAVAGPMLETKAEYRYLRIIGADAVGMSTVPEVIAAVHLGLSTCAISILTDECNPDDLQPVNIPEIIKIAGEAEPKITRLFINLINEIDA